MADLTVSDLMQALMRIGADPSTTIVRVNGASDWSAFQVSREDGRAVVDLEVEDNCGEALRDEAAYAKWRGAQTPRPPALLTEKQRGQAADYLASVNG